MEQLPGTLILITGRSGAGKDTLIKGVRKQMKSNKRLVFARRAITRPADTEGENHLALTDAEFAARRRAGEFWVDWQAHGLNYALPMELQSKLESGISVLANVSRTMLERLNELWPNTIVIEIEAPASSVSERLTRRGRETNTDIQQRLKRHVPPAPGHIVIEKLVNDNTVEHGIKLFRQMINSHLPSNESSELSND